MAAVARSEASNPRGAVPSVERLLQAPAGAVLAARWRREHVVETTRAVLEEIRRATGDGSPVPPEDEVLRRGAPRPPGRSAPPPLRGGNTSGRRPPPDPPPPPPPRGGDPGAPGRAAPRPAPHPPPG